MTLEIKHFQEKPPQFRAVKITLDNYEEVAKWIEAHSFTKTVVSDGSTNIIFKSRNILKERGQDDDVVIEFVTDTGEPYNYPMYMVQQVGQPYFTIMTEPVLLRNFFQIPEEVTYDDGVL